MYVQGQWLWDRVLLQPVQYMGVEVNLEGPARWHVKENGEEKIYEFNGYQWWRDRYTHILDGQTNKILKGNCKPDASQFHGGPFPDCVEIALKPSQPTDLSQSPLAQFMTTRKRKRKS